MEFDLVSHRLLLRRPVDEDLGEIASLHGDPDVMRFIDDGRPVPQEVTRSRDLPWLTADYGIGRATGLELRKPAGVSSVGSDYVRWRSNRTS